MQIPTKGSPPRIGAKKLLEQSGSLDLPSKEDYYFTEHPVANTLNEPVCGVLETRIRTKNVLNLISRPMRCIASKDKGISQRLFKRINEYYAMKHERVTKWSTFKKAKINIHNNREYERSGGGGGGKPRIR